MRKKVKRAIKEIVTLLGFSFVIGLFLCKPLIKEWLKKDFYVVYDDMSAQQEVGESDNIEVEFRCYKWEFPKLLTSFKKAHKEFCEIDTTTVEEETSFLDNEDSTRSFIVTFFKN